MDHIARSEVGLLAEIAGRTCVSLYLPTHRAGSETRQDPIRLKNLLRQANTLLEDQKRAGSEIKALLSPIEALLDNYDFWQHGDEGLAIFRSPDLFLSYCLNQRVPELVVVNEHFHLKPLFPHFTGLDGFYVLALSQNRIRLFRGARDGMVEVETDSMPGSLAETLRTRTPERQLHAHSASVLHSGPGAAIFHGHGGGEEGKKELLFAYFRRVDEAVRELLGDEQAPLILAAVDYLCPIYRRANTHKELLADWIAGSTDHLSTGELHQRALPIAAEYFRKSRQKAAERYLDASHTGRASKRPEEVARAAHAGRVELLFVAVGVQVRDGAAPGAEDLLNAAALQTYAHGGEVYAVSPEEVPGGGPLAALYRY